MSVVEYLNGINRVLAKLGHLSDESQVLESTVTMLVDQPANVCAAIYLLDPATTQWTRRAQAGPDCPVICPVPPKQVVAPVRLRSGPASDGMVQAFAFPIHLEAIITGAMLIGTAVEHDETMVAVNAMLASVIGSLVSVVAEQEQLYAALDEAPALISIHRAPDHRLVFTNRRYREMVPEAQLGHAPHDFLEPETAAQQLALQKQVLATGTPFLGEAIPIDVSTLAGFSEDVAYFDYTLQPLRHGRADPGLFVHATDVTGSVQALEEAQRAQERYRQLVDDVDAIVWEVDVETFDFTFVSRAAETMTGYPLAGWTDPGFWVEIMHPEDRDFARTYCASRLQVADDFDFEYRIVCQDGRILWVHDLVHVGRDRDGKPINLRGIMLDITERRLAAEEKRMMRDKLFEVQRLESLGVLAGGIAHDFNNLLTAVLGNAGVARELLPADHAAVPRLEGALKATRRAADLTHQLLAYSGKGAFTVAPLSLNLLIEESTDLLRTSVPKKVSLELQLAPDLPLIEGDRPQVQQVLMNLVLNGAEAMGERGGSVLVTTSVEQMDGEPHVRLTVTDEGAGMDADTCARIFEPFYTTKTRGRGLGLAAVQGIVRGHHGQLRLRSTPGRGTTFDILLPASSSTDVPPLSSAELPAVLSGGIVLLVDDEDDVRIAAAFMLEHLGYTVIEATDGRDGVNKFREYHSQLTAVLLDLTMPVMNGSEAFSAMQEISMNVPVILSSGYDETEATRRFSGGTLAGFLKKPYTLRQLADAMISEG